jgi:hypothetical protein
MAFFPQLLGTSTAYVSRHQQLSGKAVCLALHYVGYFFIRFAESGIRVSTEPAHCLAMKDEVS